MGRRAEKFNTKKNKEKKNIEPETSAQDNTTTTTNNNNNNGRKIITDARFSSIHSDPRFQKVPKHQSKVSIDSRFNRMFTDKKFSSSSSRIDKRGKPNNQNSANPLRHYYKIDEEELKKIEVESESEDDDEEELKKKDVESESEDDEGSEDIENEDLKKLDTGSSDAELSSDSEELKLDKESGSDSTSSDTDDEDGVYSDEEPEEPEKIEEIEQETHRLAIVNMDWSQVRAVDLYVMMNSFLPKGGQILSVSVYPSEFGLKRMEEEAVKGPVGLFDSDKETSDAEDNDEIDNEKLRAYEKSRLSYYYAVVECDSSATADYIYKTCDGMELERTSNVLDLRFIPDSRQFEHPPRDVATEAPTKYEGLDFQTQALQQSKIHLSWDEDEPQRAKTLGRKLNADQLAELEWKEFLASDEGESEDDDDDEGEIDGRSARTLDKADKLRALLQAGGGSDGDGSEDDNDMEVTFNTGLEDISKRILESKKDKKSETVWDAYLRKKKDKKKARKNRSKDSSEDESSDSNLEAPEQPDDFFVEEASVKNSKLGKGSLKKKQEQDADKEQEASKAELELLLADDQEVNHLKGYNLKPKKAKGKKGEDLPAEDKLPSVVDFQDPRFSALFTSPLFALDPTDPQYKRSAAYARQLAQRQQKGLGEEITNKEKKKPPRETPLPPPDDTISKRSEQVHSESTSSNPELSSMIRSLKRKSQQYQAPCNGKASKKQSNGPLQKLSSRFLSGKKKAKVSNS